MQLILSICIIITLVYLIVIYFKIYLFSMKEINIKKNELKRKLNFENQKLKEEELFKRKLEQIENMFYGRKNNEKINMYLDYLTELKNLTNYPKIKIYNNLRPQIIEMYSNYVGEKKFIKNLPNVNEFLNCFDKMNFKNKNQEFFKLNYLLNEEKKYNNLLSDIDGKSLDIQQRKAVLTEEENTLVIAGAGSGKTLTISAKVKYLVEAKNIKPKDILLITFTKKSALEMEERISEKLGINVNVKTFHALGYDIMGYFENKKPDILEDIDSYINKFINIYLKSNRELQENILKYFSLYLNDSLNPEDFETLGEYYKANKSNSFESLKSKLTRCDLQEQLNTGVENLQKSKKTIKGEKVKSLEELKIANYLFSNGINYIYEEPYKIKTSSQTRKQYTPDFYLVDYDIYLEHFGITKDEKCPQYSKVEEEKYIESINWKRKLHKLNKTKLVETYSWENKEGILIQKLDKIIKDNSIKINKISSEKITEIIYNLTKDIEFKEIYKLLNTFLGLFKSNNYNISHIKIMNQQAMKNNNLYIKNKHLLFLKIFTEYYKFYENELKIKSKIDFNDMINKAIEYIEKNSIPNQFNFKYIIIDEFQDISMSRYKLIKAIKNKTNSNIMAVGDDWQSIYRFAGSEISIFTDFKKYFGETEILKIENTYRNSQNLINIAGKFVMENNHQIKKDLKSSKIFLKPIKIVCFKEIKKEVIDSEEISLTNQLMNILNELNSKKINLDVMLLGRNNFDIKILEASKFFTLLEKDGKTFIKCELYKNLNIYFLTVHKSKGLEADYVILINNKNNITGFPNKIVGDSVLNYVMKSEENFLYAEERRLFYVALTRTKNATYLLAPQDSSIFVEELKKIPEVEILEIESEEKLHCPKCKSGHLVARKGKNNSEFLSCSNYPQCDFILFDKSIIKNKVICPKCSGFMTLRKGSYGDFYGCTNYPVCTTTIKVENVGGM
ncbi:MAG: UvrD-helicase domain-containing protein [Aeromonas sp.]